MKPVIQSSHICTRSPFYRVFLLLICIIFGHILFQSNMLIARQHEMFGVTTSDIDYIVNTARRMDVTPVMVTLVNDAYLPFVYNWLCNTRDISLHQQVLIIATSQQTKRDLQTISPDLNIAVIPIGESLQTDQDFSQVGYIRIMIRRTQIMSALLQNGIETLLFECDFLWIKNPLEVFNSYRSKHDMVFIGNSKLPNTINGGFMYMFPTNKTKAVLSELNIMMQNLGETIKNQRMWKLQSPFENDQFYLSKLVNDRFAGINTIVLPLTEFADGQWYGYPKQLRALINPYVIHNDWLSGNKNKIARAKEWGHWFLRDDNTCDFNLVEITLNQLK